jgi:hypothetical protein
LPSAAGSLFCQVLQKVETGDKFAETAHVWGVAHGVLQAVVEMGGKQLELTPMFPQLHARAG